jgi:predicted ester cyclase
MGAADIVRRQAEAQNKYDFDTVVGFFADKVSWADPTDHVDGRDAVRTKYDTLYSMFPDGQVELGTVVEQGDMCMYQEAFRGTDTGNMIMPDGTSMPATGRPVTVDSMVAIRIEGGKIAEYKIIYDQLAIMMSLGVMPPPG